MSCPLVMACDSAFAMPLATALRSIADANPCEWPFEVHVLSHGFSEETRKRVSGSLPTGSAVINWHMVDLALLENFAISEHVSRMTYARLLIPYFLNADVPKVLYLDSDVLALGELAPLWNTDLDGRVVGAVLDDLDPCIKSDKAGLERVPRVANYFNAGVLLIDLNRWRNEQVSEKALQYLSKYPRARFWDQDALNVVCDGRWQQLDARWNFQDLAGRLEGMETKLVSADPRPGIVHFVSNAKPWIPRVRSANADFYDDVRSRTCFARTNSEKLFDFAANRWSLLKSFLKRYTIVHVIQRRLRHLQVASTRP